MQHPDPKKFADMSLEDIEANIAYWTEKLEQNQHWIQPVREACEEYLEQLKALLVLRKDQR